jgi:predicted RNase H-like HicB family nuclease
MMKKKKVSVPNVILKSKTGYNAFSPLVDGCIAAAKTVDAAITSIKEALEFYLGGEMLVNRRRRNVHAVLTDALGDYGTDALYATISVVNG